MHMGVPWQIAIALRKGGRQPHTERVDERGHLERLFQDTIVGGTLRIIRPVCGHILTGIAEGIGPFHPDFFTFHSTLEPLKDTELIVLPVNPDVALVLFEHSVMPAWKHDAVERHLLGEVLSFGPQGLLDDGKGFDDRLKAILAPKGQMLEDPRQHLPIVVDVLLPHDIVIPDAVLGSTGLRFGHELPKGLFLHLGKSTVRMVPSGSSITASAIRYSSCTFPRHA